MPPEIGFGIIGTGFVAGYHAQAIRETPGARLVGVASRSDAGARDFAGRNGVQFWTTRSEELLARDDIQVVCITTPSGSHLEPGLAAIRAGKHLIVEKPIEITLERVDALLHAADNAGVRVMSIFQNRFGPGAQLVKTALEQNRFGKVVMAGAYVKWHRQRDYYKGNRRGMAAVDGGGALMNQGIHAVDLLQWFVGMPKEVFGWTTRCVHLGIEVEDTAAAVLHFGNGALGAIEATTAAYPGWARRLEICGEHGSAALEDDRLTRWEFREKIPGDEAISDAGNVGRANSGAGTPQISHVGHLLQIKEMVAALQDGRSPSIDGRAGRNAVAIVNAVYESAATGRPVLL